MQHVTDYFPFINALNTVKKLNFLYFLSVENNSYLTAIESGVCVMKNTVFDSIVSFQV